MRQSCATYNGKWMEMDWVQVPRVVRYWEIGSWSGTSPHPQVALLSCSGIISLIWFRRKGLAWRARFPFSVFLFFFCSVFLLFVLVLFLFCRCVQCINVSMYQQWGDHMSSLCHHYVTFFQFPSAVSPPSWPFSSRWVESLASSSPAWEGEPLTRRGRFTVDFQGASIVPIVPLSHIHPYTRSVPKRTFLGQQKPDRSSM